MRTSGTIRTRRLLPQVLVGAVMLTCWTGAMTGVEAQQSSAGSDAASVAMQKLARLEGDWQTEQVEFLGPDGSIRKVTGASATNQVQLDGRVLYHAGRLAEPAIATRGWYFFDAAEGRLKMQSVTDSGRIDEFVGGWDGERLVMQTRPDANGRQFRMTHADITDDSYLETMEISEDGGASWRLTSRQHMRRTGTGGVGDAEPVLQALDQYVGHWRSDQKRRQTGDTYHFEYDLGWLDAGRSMVTRMVISQVASDGSVTRLFEGYKGRGPKGTVYYFAASPAGRGALGQVVLEGQNVVTAYEGWAAEGNVVNIRDVFEPVRGDSFVSRTYLKSSVDEPWRKVAEDTWTRVR